MVDAVRYQDIVRSGENANCESGYLEPISCTDEGEYTEYTELDTLPDSSPVSSTDHAVNASKSEEKPVYHTIGKPDRKRIAITTKENGNKRPKQILDSSATKKLKVLCIVSLAIIIVITVATVALVYILVNKTVATERKSDELQAEIEQLKLQTLNASGSSHLLESRLQSLESRTGDVEQLKRMTSNLSSDNKKVKTKLEELESKFEDIEQLKRMMSNVSSDNKNVKTKLEELESKFEDIEQLKHMNVSSDNKNVKTKLEEIESKFEGDRYFDRQDAFDLATSQENIRNRTSYENTTSDDADLIKSIDPDSETCCDVYFLIDMSKSMTNKDFEKAKDFIKALLPKIGISDEESATRIALYLFAQDVNKSIDDTWTDKAKFTNYTEVEAIIDKLARKEIFRVVGEATDLSKALYTVQIAAETKSQRRTKQNRGLRENVLILLSDGDYTGGGYPADKAKILKDNLEFQIYSIAIGESRKGMNLPILQQIASQDDIDNPLDKHFVTIEGKDLRTTTGVCGGSLVLTAAHCFEKNTTDVRFHTCPEPWKDKLKTMYEDKKRYPNKTGPANFLILRTCDSHYAEYAVLVKITGHGNGTGEQRYSDVSAEVLTVFNHGQERLRMGMTMHIIWRMDCKWPMFLKGKKYYIIARDGLPYTDDAGNKIFKYYIREGDIVLEWRNLMSPVGKFMIRGYERFWSKGKQCPK